MRHYWIYSIPVWLFWSYLIIVITGDRFPVTPALFFPTSYIVPWISGVNIVFTALILKTFKDHFIRIVGLNMLVFLLLPVIFVLSLTIQNPFVLSITVLIVCVSYLTILYFLYFNMAVDVIENEEKNILFLSGLGILCQLYPFIRRRNDYAKPFDSNKTKKDKRLGRTVMEAPTVIDKENKEISNYYNDFFWVMLGSGLQFFALILSLNF